MDKKKTIAELAEEARLREGAKNYKGHDYMALARFFDDTRHMVIFDVLTSHAKIGDKGDRMRLFLTDEGYERALGEKAAGNIRIITHADVRAGHLFYTGNRGREQVR